MNTKKEIVDKIYYILWEEQDSTVFDKEGEIVPKINEIIDKICRCEVTNILTQQKIRWWILNFLYEEKTIKIPKQMMLMVDIDEDTTTLTLDRIDWLPNKWYLDIWWNIVSYDGIDTDWTILKVQWVNWYHEAKTKVNFAYRMPSKVLKPADIFDNQFWWLLKFSDFRENNVYTRGYTLKPYQWKNIAIFYNVEWTVTISYSKKLDPVESDDDECGLPDDYWKRIVPYLVTWQILIDTTEVDKWQKLLSIWYAELEDMYSFYATPNKQFRKKIKTTPLYDFLP